jgi:hypothetical protein
MLNTFDDSVECLTSVPNFKQMIVVIVTKFDQCDEQHQAIARTDIKDLFSEEDVTKVIFSSKNTSPQDLSDMLYAEISYF